MHLSISHTTSYRYDAPIQYGLQKIRLRPFDSAQQRVTAWDIEVEGGSRDVMYIDQYGNGVELVSTPEGASEVKITASGTVETTDTSGVFGPAAGPAPLWHFLRPTPLTEAGDGIRDLAGGMATFDQKLDALHDLSARIAKAVEYGSGSTYAATPAEAALAGKRGVCQDHAQIFVSAARVAGIPARYVSGYLMMDDRVDQDASHAWAEAYLDNLGWVGFDISNGQSPDERYVRIACGRDYRDAAPVSGLRHGTGDESMIVSLQIQQ